MTKRPWRNCRNLRITGTSAGRYRWNLSYQKKTPQLCGAKRAIIRTQLMNSKGFLGSKILDASFAGWGSSKFHRGLARIWFQFVERVTGNHIDE
jgi:hypothetical protein